MKAEELGGSGDTFLGTRKDPVVYQRVMRRSCAYGVKVKPPYSGFWNTKNIWAVSRGWWIRPDP